MSSGTTTVFEGREGPSAVIASIEQIGPEWRLVVLHHLQGSEKWFDVLERSTDASARTLSRVRDDLASYGFVGSRLEDSVPAVPTDGQRPKAAALSLDFDGIEECADE